MIQEESSRRHWESNLFRLQQSRTVIVNSRSTAITTVLAQSSALFKGASALAQVRGVCVEVGIGRCVKHAASWYAGVTYCGEVCMDLV